MRGSCVAPCARGFCASVDSACARSASASSTSSRGSSWSSSASSSCSGYTSGLPSRRARSSAAATASRDLIVSLLKSISIHVPYLCEFGRRPVEHQLPLVGLVHLVDRAPHLALHAVKTVAHSLHLVLQAQDVLD